MKMGNRWNRFVYRLWSPVYDVLLEWFFSKGRRRAMEVVGLRSGERVCFIGIGTGSDLLLLPEGADAVGIDLSEAMLAQARKKLPIPGRNVELQVGNAQELPIVESTFHVVILNLILSVVPDPVCCLEEALRVLRPDGRIVVFDKFLPDNSRPSWGRRLANIFSTLFGTDVNRCLGDIISGHQCVVEHDEPSILGGMYRVALVRPTGDGCKANQSRSLQ